MKIASNYLNVMNKRQPHYRKICHDDSSHPIKTNDSPSEVPNESSPCRRPRPHTTLTYYTLIVLSRSYSPPVVLSLFHSGGGGGVE